MFVAKDGRPRQCRPVGAAPRRCHIGKVRKPCVWIAGFPFDLEDFDTGWEYLYDGLVYPEVLKDVELAEAESASTTSEPENGGKEQVETDHQEVNEVAKTEETNACRAESPQEPPAEALKEVAEAENASTTTELENGGKEQVETDHQEVETPSGSTARDDEVAALNAGVAEAYIRDREGSFLRSLEAIHLKDWKRPIEEFPFPGGREEVCWWHPLARPRGGDQLLLLALCELGDMVVKDPAEALVDEQPSLDAVKPTLSTTSDPPFEVEEATLLKENRDMYFNLYSLEKYNPEDIKRWLSEMGF